MALEETIASGVRYASLGISLIVLLITSLLIIPPAAAQRHARTPEQMALGASVLGMLAVLGGLALSWELDTPAGPSVVVCAAALFMLALAIPRRA